MISSNSPFSSNLVRLTPRQKHAVPLILGALKRRGRVQVGQDHEADVVRMEVLPFSGMQDEGFEREVNRREKGKKNQDYRGPKNGPREQALI